MADAYVKEKDNIRAAQRGFNESWFIILLFIATLSIVSLFIILWLSKLGNTPQIYTDIVLEELGAEFANKSIELILYWLGIFLGIIIISTSYYVSKNKLLENYIDEKKYQHNLLFFGLMIFIAGGYLFYGNINVILSFLILVAVGTFFI